MATFFWGFGFIVITWSLGSVGPLWINAARFLFSAALLAPLVFFSKSLRSFVDRAQFFMAFGPGLFLALTLILQTTGLRYTSATNSGFITTLYALFVPVFGMIVFGRKVPWLHGVFVATALMGTALICGLLNGHTFNLNKGDILTLGCAFTATVQILWIDHISSRIQSPITFNLYQCFWSGLTTLILALFFEGWGTTIPSPQAWLGILFLTLACTLFGFVAQVRAQKVLTPSVASMMFLLESPFGALFAFVFLNERLEAIQWIGAVLILGSAACAVHLETRHQNSPTP